MDETATWDELNDKEFSRGTMEKILPHRFAPEDGIDRLSLPGLLPDWILTGLCKKGMVEPFVDHQVTVDESGNKVISYGLSSYGIDLRLGNKFKIFNNVNAGIIDVKNSSVEHVIDREGDTCIIPPNSYMLGCTVERFKLPRDITMLIIGKSTFARAGVIVNCTPGEAGWEGYLTLEFSNATSLPVKVYSGEGCCQALFFRGAAPCVTSYADRAGKYQNQSAVPVLPRLKN